MRTSKRSKFPRSHYRSNSKDYKSVYNRAQDKQRKDTKNSAMRDLFLHNSKNIFALLVGLIVLPIKVIRRFLISFLAFLALCTSIVKNKLNRQSKSTSAGDSKKKSSKNSVQAAVAYAQQSISGPKNSTSSKAKSNLSNNSRKSVQKKNSKQDSPWYETIITNIENRPLAIYLAKHVKRMTLIQTVFVMVFGLIVWKMADLQVTSSTQERLSASPAMMGNQIILASRGQIYFKDISQSKSDIPLTTTVSLAHVFFDAAVLKEQINKGIITLETASMMVASALNISYGTVFDLFRLETQKDPASKYVLITKFVDNDQKKAVEYLRFPTYTGRDDNYVPPFNSWLNFEPIESRFYPENDLLASTIGYVPRYYGTTSEALNAGCADMVNQNEARQTVNTFIPGDFNKGQYAIGYYGIEQKYCSALAGLNGKKPLNKDLNTIKEADSRVQNGANVYLTIDRNIQREAEIILQKAVAENEPTDGSILVMEAKTGKVLAMANYPTFNPNNYTKADPAAFRNVTTSGDYEAGSVIKPLTIASALNEWENGSVDSSGNRIGVPPNWTFNDFDTKGKPYQENNGRIFFIRNSQGLSWKERGPQTLSNVLRDSINTGIAEIQPTLGNSKTREYFRERYLFGQPTLIDLPGDTNGNVVPLTTNIDSPFTYATHGFGQGFTVSPLQLARGFTALANKGKRVEPVLVDKIVYADGRTETSQTAGSDIQQPAAQQVFSENVSKLVTGYLVDTVDQGYLGAKPSKGKVPGYTIAGKTGTSEVGRIPQKSCGTNFSIYECNTSQGIYDHTFIGYGPVNDPQIIVVVKLSEPKKGVVANFAENTTGPFFSQMMGYTLQYLGIPKEPGR